MVLNIGATSLQRPVTFISLTHVTGGAFKKTEHVGSFAAGQSEQEKTCAPATLTKLAPIFHPCGVVCFVYRKEADVRAYIVTDLWGRGVSAICGALRRRVYTCRDTKQPPMLNSLNAILRQDRHPRHHARLAASCCCYRRRCFCSRPASSTLVRVFCPAK